MGDFMSETKFTLGPWKMKNDGFVYSVTTGERVCSPHSTLPEKSEYRVSDHIKDLKANARLIAAAPDLYWALVLAKDMMIANDCSLQETFEVIDAALTKARGEK
jgi:hypothetical protein